MSIDTERTKLKGELEKTVDPAHDLRYVPDVDAVTPMQTSTLQTKKHCKTGMAALRVGKRAGCMMTNRCKPHRNPLRIRI